MFSREVRQLEPTTIIYPVKILFIFGNVSLLNLFSSPAKSTSEVMVGELKTFLLLKAV